ncbi:MAG: hypothetical protein ABI220_01120 [Candidatus Saccharimonadales bacterium]
MSAAERDFSNFQLGDNVYELGGGVIPDIAERLDFEIGTEPDSDKLGALVKIIGENKVLRENEEVQAISLDKAADLVNRSGVQEPLARSLWTPDKSLPSHIDTVIVTGAVANWQDRTASLLVDAVKRGFGADNLYLLSGNREMSSKSEINNQNIIRYYKEYGVYPLESNYATEFVKPMLEEAGYNVTNEAFETGKGDAIAAEFAANHSDVWIDDKTVSVARVANAGIQLAVQMQRAARDVNPKFDMDRNNPQLFVQADTRLVASAREQLDDPANYQSPFTAMRQLVLTARYLLKASLDQ